ncbi:hypothetical protein ACA910_007094 [Epithemia clementina (nom. ined.)]
MSFAQDNQQSSSVTSIAIKQAFNIDDGRHVVEGPTPRSIQIASRGPELLRPPTGLTKTRPLSFERPTLKSRACSKGSVGMAQEWDELSWIVDSQDLDMVPEDYPLERTHRVINGAEASIVAKRISEILRSHSVETSFKSKPPKAKCKTRDFVSFRIRLYAGSESGDPVVVELQRRSGPASCFMRVCRDILDAAEGKAWGAQRSQPPFVSKPIGQMKCLEGLVEPAEDVNQTAYAVLADTMVMLRSKKRDSNLLGLENLCSLTDPIKTKPSVALSVAKSIALGSEDAKSIALGSEDDDIREEIMALTERDVFSPNVADDVALSNHAELLRQCALTVFANSLSLCSKDGCLVAAFEEQRWFRDCLVPTLLDEIRRAESNGCNATQAAICMHSIASCSPTARTFLTDQGADEALRAANKFGKACNELLANESERCLKVLQLEC